MTREQEIKDLQARYLIAVAQHKRKTAALIYARLSSLMLRELKAEIRKDRRTAA